MKKNVIEKIFFVTTRQARQNMGMFFIYCISYCLNVLFPNQHRKTLR